MRDAFRHKERAAVGCTEFRREGLLVGRRLRPEVQRHIMHSAGHASHHFGLGVWDNLKMHAPQSAAAGVVREIALGQIHRQSLRGKSLAAPRTREPAAVVLVAIQVDHIHAGQMGLGKLHQIRRTSGIGIRNRPPASR